MLLVVTQDFLLDLGVRDNLRDLGGLARGWLLDSELLNTVRVDLELLMAEFISSLVA